MGWRMGGGSVGMRYPMMQMPTATAILWFHNIIEMELKNLFMDLQLSILDLGEMEFLKGDARYEGNNQCRTSYSYSGETYNDVYYTTAYWERSVVAYEQAMENV